MRGGDRPLVDQLQVWAHYATLPRQAGPLWRRQHLARVDQIAVVNVAPRNLRLVGVDEAEAAMEQWAAFLNGLTFAVQIVARAMPVDLDAALAELEARTDARSQDLAAHLRAQADTHALLERQRLVAVSAPTADVLSQRVDALLDGLQRAGLRGHRLNGEMRDVLQSCWSPQPADEHIGPQLVRIQRDYLGFDNHRNRKPV